mmetsp:Transcript_29059/g.83425  ORF Transcript_29059/g.83425 Transcript_29059/m.83425 type:complete len:87 (-) Transcript_29059:2823-3083(-)
MLSFVEECLRNSIDGARLEDLRMLLLGRLARLPTLPTDGKLSWVLVRRAGDPSFVPPRLLANGSSKSPELMRLSAERKLPFLLGAM